MFIFICSTQQRWSGSEKITFCHNSGVSATIRRWDLDPNHQDGEVSGWLLHQDAAYDPKHPLARPHEKLQSVCWLAKGYREDPWTPPQACSALCPPLRACPLPNHPLRAHPRQGFSWEKSLSFIDTLKRDTGLISAEELRSCMLDRNIWRKITEQARASRWRLTWLIGSMIQTVSSSSGLIQNTCHHSP